MKRIVSGLAIVIALVSVSIAIAKDIRKDIRRSGLRIESPTPLAIGLDRSFSDRALHSTTQADTVILGYCFKCKQSFVGKHECEEIPKMKSISEWMFTIRCRRGFVMCPDCALHNKCRRFKKHRRYLEGK